jgi:hypothetical protein
MGKYTAEIRYIASIYPGKLEPQTKFHGPERDSRKGRATRYWLPPVPRHGKPVLPKEDNVSNVKIHKIESSTGVRYVAVLEVPDAFESIPNPIDSVGGRLKFNMGPVLCDEIANNLMQYWGGNFVDLPPGAAPGMIIIQNEIPTVAEMDRMILMQKNFYEYRLMQGDNAANQNRWKEITQEMKDAVVYLGKERPWSGGMLTVDCPLCFSPIPAQAAICNRCGHRIKPIPADLAALNPSLAGPVAASK